MADDPQITEITTHTINILRVAEGQRQAAVARLDELQGEITTMLEKSEKLSPNRLSRLRALQEQTSNSIDQAYSDISGQHQEGLKKLAGIEAKKAVSLVNTKIGVDLVSVAIPEKLLEAVVDGPHIFGNSAKEHWLGQAADLQQKFKAGMQQGVLLGETVDQLAARVRGTKANSYEDGMMATKRREAQALVRSSAISIANEARLRQFEEMGDLVKGIQWVATLDTRTTAQCRALDGKQWRLPDYEPVGHDKAFPGPTAHWNCRSTQIAVLRSWDELSGKKLPSLEDQAITDRMREILKGKGWSDEKLAKVQAGTRASMDGQVAESVGFEDWLRHQPDDRVESILGPGRKALWDAGQVTVTQMTDQTNRPLTLAQLEQLVATGGTAPETLGVNFLPMVSESTSLSAKTTAELNRKASKEIDEIEADPEAKPKPTPPDNSAATIAAILASPAGQTLKAKWIAKIQKENPEMEPKDVLANATQQALLEQTSKSKAAALAAAKKKLLAGEDLTPTLKKTVAELTPEEATNFNDSVQAAKDAAAAKAEASKAKEETATTKQTLAQEQAAAAKQARLQAITDLAARNQAIDNADRTGLSKAEVRDAVNAGFRIKAQIENGLIKDMPGPPVVQDPVQAFKEAFYKFDKDTDARGQTVAEIGDVAPYLGTKDEGVAVLSAFGHGTFTEINNPSNEVERKAAAAMLRMLEVLPNAEVKKIHRVVAFDTDERRAKFLQELAQPEGQARTVTSWTEEDPGAKGQTPNNNIALDVASQFGDARVFMTVRDPITAKEISFLYGREVDGKGTEYVLTKGTSLKIVSQEERNGDVHIVLEQTAAGRNKAAPKK